MFDGGKRHLNFNVNEKATLYHKNGIFIISCIFFLNRKIFCLQIHFKISYERKCLKKTLPPLKPKTKEKKVKNNFEPNTDKIKKKNLGNIIIIHIIKKKITK